MISLTSLVREVFQIADNVALKRALESLEYSLGPEMMQYMNDDDVTELMVNPDCKLWIDTFSRGCIDTGIKMNPNDSKQIIYSVAALSNQTIDEKTAPFLQAEIPDSYLFDSCRFQAELPGIVTSPSFNIRKHPQRILTFEDLLKSKTVNEKQVEIIKNAIYDHKNIVIAGGTNSGKTTFTNTCLLTVSELSDRIVMLEDTPELRCSAENCISLRATDSVNMNQLLRITLRLSPNRIIVGEVRGEETFTLLTAWSTGHHGGITTVHSDSALDTLYRLQEAIELVSLSPQQRKIGRAVDVVVYLRKVDRQRFVEEIIEVKSYDSNKGEYITKKLD